MLLLLLRNICINNASITIILTTIITIAIITIGNITMPIFMFMNATAVSRVGVGAGGSGASGLLQRVSSDEMRGLEGFRASGPPREQRTGLPGLLLEVYSAGAYRGPFRHSLLRRGKRLQLL